MLHLVLALVLTSGIINTILDTIINNITVFFNIVLMYLPKLYDYINMIIYGLSGRCYYRDVKWYRIKYYNKK